MTPEQRQALIAAAQARKAELDAVAADRDKISGVVEQLKVLTAEGLPTTLTKWAALGANLIKILAEAVIE